MPTGTARDARGRRAPRKSASARSSGTAINQLGRAAGLTRRRRSRTFGLRRKRSRGVPRAVEHDRHRRGRHGREPCGFRHSGRRRNPHRRGAHRRRLSRHPRTGALPEFPGRARRQLQRHGGRRGRVCDARRLCAAELRRLAQGRQRGTPRRGRELRRRRRSAAAGEPHRRGPPLQSVRPARHFPPARRAGPRGRARSDGSAR